MSKWCPKCQRVNQKGDTCDFCGQVLENTSNKDILLNQILQEISDEHKENPNNIYQEKKTRAALYTDYIADHYRELGYSVTEQRKENNVENNGIDLIVKKDDEVIFIQCKEWNKNNLHKIGDKEIKILRIDTYDFLEQNPTFKTYKIKMRYILSENFIDTSAITYIDKCKDDISYEVIESNYRSGTQIKPNYTNKISSKNNSKAKKNLEKIIVVILIILAILFFLKPSIETEQTESGDADKKIISITKTDKAAQKQAQEKLKAQQEQKETERIRKLLAVQKAEREKHQKEQKARIEKEKAEQTKILIEKKSIENPKINIKQNDVPKVLNEESARAASKRRLLKEMQVDNKKASSKKEKDDPRAKAKRKLLEQMQFGN